MVVIANHVSYWDPVVVGSLFPRQVYFMAKKELFSYPVLGMAIKRLGAFPVDREHAARTAIKRALTLLKNGEVVGIFPEGTRSKTGELLAPYQGAAYLAVRAGVPVCPIALRGTKKIFDQGLFRKFHIRIGPPMIFKNANRQDLQPIASAMIEKIQELLDIYPG